MNFIKWLFTLRRITKVVIYYFIAAPVSYFLYDCFKNTLTYYISISIFCIGLAEFVDWNFKQNDYEII